MAKYRKKPVVVDAVKWIGNLEDLDELGYFSCKVQRNHNCLKIETLEGVMTANLGDWIIKGVHDELYPCKPDIFNKTYEKIKNLKDHLN